MTAGKIDWDRVKSIVKSESSIEKARDSEVDDKTFGRLHNLEDMLDFEVGWASYPDQKLIKERIKKVLNTKPRHTVIGKVNDLSYKNKLDDIDSAEDRFWNGSTYGPNHGRGYPPQELHKLKNYSPYNDRHPAPFTDSDGSAIVNGRLADVDAKKYWGVGLALDNVGVHVDPHDAGPYFGKEGEFIDRIEHNIDESGWAKDDGKASDNSKWGPNNGRGYPPEEIGKGKLKPVVDED